MPQSSASSLMVILSRDFVRSSFFKAASSASFVILAIACPPLFLCIRFHRILFAKVVVRQLCKHVDFLILIILYDNRLKMSKLTFYKKTLAFCKIPWYHLICVSGCGSAWLERRLREAEVASSNPATPIHLKASKSFTRFWRLLFCIIFAALENCRKNLKNIKNGLLFIKFYAMIIFVPGCGSAWLERRLREAEVASSNPATPIH